MADKSSHAPPDESSVGDQLNVAGSNQLGTHKLDNVVIDIESEDLTYNQARAIR